MKAISTALVVAVALCPASAFAQDGSAGTRNLSVVEQLPALQATDVEFDQDESRPYLYVADVDGSVRVVASDGDVSVLQTWTITDGVSGHVTDVEHFRIGGRHYLAAGVSNQDGSGAVAIAEVTAVRRDATVREVARHETGAVQELFAYKHSSGRALLAVADGGPLRIYDGAALLSSAEVEPVAEIVTPQQLERSTSGFDHVFLGFHPDTESDRLYAAGAGGYYVFDVTDPDTVQTMAIVNPATIRRGGALAPTPDANILVSSAGYRGSPVRMFDLRPVFSGELPMVRTATSAWAANWQNMCSAFEIRWPLVFSACMDDGLQIFNIRDESAPYTVGYYHTWQPSGPVDMAIDRNPEGAWTLDVRNADGMIAVGDRNTGLWLIRLDGFQGWNGHGYGLPNVSSAQDWVGGPDRFGPQ